MIVHPTHQFRGVDAIGRLGFCAGCEVYVTSYEATLACSQADMQAANEPDLEPPEIDWMTINQSVSA